MAAGMAAGELDVMGGDGDAGRRGRCGRAKGIEDWGCERIGRRALPVDACVCVREGGGGIERRRRPEGEMGIGLGLTVV